MKNLNQLATLFLTAFALAVPNQTFAQFTGNNQTNIISGVSTNWGGPYYVGSNYVFDALLIQNGGKLVDTAGYIGYAVGAKSNIVIVSGSGSVWSNYAAGVGGALYVGFSGAGNRLVISNQAKVYTHYAYLGNSASSSNNSALVTGSGSLWNIEAYGTEFGYISPGNSLTISNGGAVFNNNCTLGYYASSANNTLLVTGPGSVWSNRQDLIFGGDGGGNRWVISNQGKVFSQGATVGQFSSSNSVLVTGSGSVWNSLYLAFGGEGSENSLVISNQGKVVCEQGGTVGGGSDGRNNSVLVTGSGSVWSNRNDTYVGRGGAGSRLEIRNHGLVISDHSGFVGYWQSASNCFALVTDPGSVWSNALDFTLGVYSSGNSLIISNQGTMFNDNGLVGYYPNASTNIARVVGSGLWRNASTLYVGYAGSSNQLIIDGGSVSASNVFVGFYATATNNVIRVDSGGLFVTNVVGNGVLVVSSVSGKAEMLLNGGAATVDSLVATNGANSVITFNGGTFNTKATLVANNQQFAAGNGISTANYHLVGGVHSFNDGLRVRNNASLTGCGSINGDMVVDPGGLVRPDCGTLLITGIVTNNGTMVADGMALEFSGTVVNNGTILFQNGGTANFSGVFVNNGVIVNGDIRLAIERDGSGGLYLRYTGTPDVTYRLQRAANFNGGWSDIATNTAPASGLIEFHEISPPPGQAFYRAAQP